MGGPSDDARIPGPCETRKTLRALRTQTAEIVQTKHDNETLENTLKVLERRSERLKFEADERQRLAQKQRMVQLLREEKRWRFEEVKAGRAARREFMSKHVEKEKRDAKSRLKKPTPTEEAESLNKFRRAGATTVAVNAKSFGTAFAAIASGKLGESITKDMKIHRQEKVRPQ